MKKVFVLVSVSWEYNDEYYSQSASDGGGVPNRVFRDEAAAQEAAVRLTLGEVHGLGTDLRDFFYGDEGWQGHVEGHEKEFTEILELWRALKGKAAPQDLDALGEILSEGDEWLPDDIDNRAWELLAQTCEGMFWDVHEVELQ